MPDNFNLLKLFQKTEASTDKMKTIKSLSLGNMVRENKIKNGIMSQPSQVGHTLWCLICSTWVLTNKEALR